MAMRDGKSKSKSKSKGDCCPTKGRSINIFLRDGDPNGIRVAQIVMSTIHAIAFRRTQLPQIRKTFPEINRPGVYILIGVDKNARQFAYIGESESVGGRLSQHNSDKTARGVKRFWDDAVALISKDENLTKSHARYVEACLIQSSSGNPRWSLSNTNKPSKDAGKLPLPDRVAMDEFVDQTKILAGALGWDLFREMIGQTSAAATGGHGLPAVAPVKSPLFELEGKGFLAKMELGPDGDFVVKSGSKARSWETESIPPSISLMRKILQDKGVLREEVGSLVFTTDCKFSSTSSAAGVVNGASANGRAVWKLPDNPTPSNRTTYAKWEESMK